MPFSTCRGIVLTTRSTKTSGKPISAIGSLHLENNDMKMYILIKDYVPTGFALVAAAHASLAAYLKFKFKDTPEIGEWLSGPFRKTICKVNEMEFEVAKMIADNVIITESALGNIEVAIAFKLLQTMAETNQQSHSLQLTRRLSASREWRAHLDRSAFLCCAQFLFARLVFNC